MCNKKNLLSEINKIDIYTKKLKEATLGKWVTFRQEGMEQILHGKIIDVTSNGEFTMKCKNGQKRGASLEDIYEIFDTKKECYKYTKGE